MTMQMTKRRVIQFLPPYLTINKAPKANKKNTFQHNIGRQLFSFPIIHAIIGFISIAPRERRSFVW